MEAIPLDRLSGYSGDVMLCYIGKPTEKTPLPIVFKEGDDNPAGIHNYCSGFLDIIPVSSEFLLIQCRRCDFQTEIPSDVNTYGKLRKYFGGK